VIFCIDIVSDLLELCKNINWGQVGVICWLAYVCVTFQLVSSFQTEAQNRTVESDQAKQKLSSLRKMIARLLKSINDVSEQYSGWGHFPQSDMSLNA